MSITKSYNKHTDTYYAYDTTYIWSEEHQKKIQKKVCIGKYDEAGNIIPNAKRGRPPRKVPASIKEADSTNKSYCIKDTEEINHAVTEILSEIHQMEKSLNDLTSKSRELESKIMILQTRLFPK
jgi:hypothetical protein